MTMQRTSHPQTLDQWTYVMPASTLSDTPLVDEDGTPLPSLREEASSDGLCYVHIIRQLACGDLYEAEVAASPSLLYSQPLTIFLSQEHLADLVPFQCSTYSSVQRAFAQRALFGYTYVAPATNVLVDELQGEASQDDLCYIEVRRRLTCGDIYQAQVAATRELLKERPLSIFLTEEQLRYALPCDDRVEGKTSRFICTLARAHALAVQPLTQTSEKEKEQKRMPYIPLEPMEKSVTVPDEIVDMTLQQKKVCINRPIGIFGMQQLWFYLALRTLKQALRHTSDIMAVRALKAQYYAIKQVRRWHRRTGQQAIMAFQSFDQHGRAAWQLVIGRPVALQAA